MSGTPHYALSQDYELMFVLLESGPLLGFVDYEQGSTLRDPVQIKRVADGKYFEYRAGVRGFGYINAFSKDAKDKFVEQCRKYNLSFIVPNAAAEASAEKAEAENARLRERLEAALDKIAEIQENDNWEKADGVCYACGICSGIPDEWQPTDDHCCREILDLWSSGEPLPWEAARRAVAAVEE